MPERMKAVALTAPRRLEIVERPIPIPGPGEALIRIKHIGLCGSDLHYYTNGRVGSTQVTYPIVLGHESAGVVVDVGPGVSRDMIGKNYCVEPQAPCGECRWCREGRYNLCPNVRFLGSAPNDGTMAEFLAFPANMMHLLPEGMSTLLGAMTEPMSVGFHAALRNGNVIPGRTALVIGAGCIGLCSVLALQKMGISQVHVTEVLDMRLNKAKELGAVSWDAKSTTNEDLLEASGGYGFDIVLECAGADDTPTQAVELCKRGGSITLVSISSKLSLDFPTVQVVRKELDVHGLFRYRNQYAQVARMIHEGSFPVEKIVSHTYPFEETPEAVRFNVEEKEKCVKIVLEV